jgi:hypothetical protein
MKHFGKENNKKEGKLDDVDTPLKYWKHILQFIPKDKTIWCPFYNEGSCAKDIESLGYKCIHKKVDFFKNFKNVNGICIDNPPYSIKKEIIDLLYKEKKPFCLLLPFDTLERKYIYKFHENLQLVIPHERYSFKKGAVNERGDVNDKPPFKSVWFCWNMKEFLGDKEMIFLNKDLK